MARERLKRLYPLALNLDAACAALSCSKTLLQEAADRGELLCYANPRTGAKRFIVEDLVLWVRATWPQSNYRSNKS